MGVTGSEGPEGLVQWFTGSEGSTGPVDHRGWRIHNDRVLRVWCLGVLLCLSIWASGGRAIECRSGTALAAHDASTCVLTAPAGDDASHRHWNAAEAPAYLVGSFRVSKAFHAVFAASPKHERVNGRTDGETTDLTPRVLRAQVQTPLLI